MPLLTYATGYAHPHYAAALAEFGNPRMLQASHGWILESPIPGTRLRDARGCYPFFSCLNWSGLEEDLGAIGAELVSLVLVTEPFGAIDHECLSRAFPDLCRPYKEHYIVDLTSPWERTVSRTHARYARKAAELLDIEQCEDPLQYLDEWIGLYEHLKQRHGIRGISRFSEQSFRKQLAVPGIRMFRAIWEGQTVGMVLFYVHEDVAYYHLAAYTDTGYRCRASYALFAYVFAVLASQVHWVCLGAGAGVYGNANDGLSRFKRGWASDTRTVFICGRVFNRAVYKDLTKGGTDSDFFPLYRAKECEKEGS